MNSLRYRFTRDSSASSTWPFLGWSLAATLILVYAWMLNRFAVNFPLQDDFFQLLAIPIGFEEASTWQEKVVYLFSSSGDHRIVTLRLAALLQTWLLGELDFRILIFFGNLLCLVAGLLVLSQATPAQRPFLAPSFAVLMVCPTNFIAQFWASAALQHFGVIAYALGALFCLSRTGRVWEIVGLFLGLFAAMTGANGLMVFPAGALLLAISGRRRTAFFWGMLAITLCGLYFIGHQSPTGRPSIFHLLEHPLRLLILYLAALGSIGERFDYAVAIGSVLVMTWIWLVATYRSTTLSPLLISWIGFLFLSSAMITLGRASLGSEALLNSRYRVYSEMAVLITTVALMWRLGSRKGSWLTVILLPLVGLWFLKSWETNLPFLADLVTKQRNSLDHYALTGHGAYLEWPPQAFGDSLLERARDAGYYSVEKKVSLPATLVENRRTLRTAPSSGLWSPLPFVYADAISTRGLAPMSKGEVTLWLQDVDHQYRGALNTQRLFDDLTGPGQILFWNTFPLTGVAPGHYRTGYALGEEARLGVVWTNDWIDVN